MLTLLTLQAVLAAGLDSIETYSQESSEESDSLEEYSVNIGLVLVKQVYTLNTRKEQKKGNSLHMDFPLFRKYFIQIKAMLMKVYCLFSRKFILSEIF